LFENNFFAAIISTLSIILTAVYSIWLYNRIMFNRVTDSFTTFADFSRKEFVVGYSFVFFAILFGLKSSGLLSMIESTLYNYLILK
jgi:NADH:ubiquinone oxidoreductase subunit 4 (subunit M)